MKVTDKIRQWAINRGLDKADANMQVVKLMEEVGGCKFYGQKPFDISFNHYGCNFVG